MNVVNRVLLAIICLGVIAAAVAIIVLAWTVPQETIDALRDTVQWLDDHDSDLEKVVLTSAAAFVGVLALTLLVLELTPAPAGEVRVTDVNTGDAVLSTAAIGQRIEEAVRSVPNIAGAKATARSKRRGVAVSLELHVDPEANLAAVSDAASQATRDVLASRVHVALAGPPQIRLHYRELRLQPGRPSTEATAPPPATVPPPEPATVASTATKGDPAEAPADIAVAAPEEGGETPHSRP